MKFIIPVNKAVYVGMDKILVPKGKFETTDKDLVAVLGKAKGVLVDDGKEVPLTASQKKAAKKADAEAKAKSDEEAKLNELPTPVKPLDETEPKDEELTF